MDYPQARGIADRLADLFRPYCDRAEIAGSIRREKETGIKDIELCVLPKILTFEAPPTPGLFEELARTEPETYTQNELAEYLDSSLPTFGERVKGQPDGKYVQFLLYEEFAGLPGVKLDLFVFTPENWGLNFTIRTGNSDFSHALLARANGLGYHSSGARLVRDSDNHVMETPEEIDVFNLLRLAWVEPKDRIDGRALRSLK